LWRYIPLAAILFLALGLRLWNIGQNGYGNSYYAAAVRSMLQGPTNFFFGSFDPAGFITVDKPPVAIWVQAVSALVFGYSERSLLVPQAVMGTLSVLLIYLLVRRVASPGAGLLAALVLAITPISVAVDRDNLPDTALVLVLLLAAWALSRALETGRLRPLLVSAALVGLAFNVKMLAAFVVLPTFYLVYLLAAPGGWWRRIGRLSVATIVLAAVSLSWVAAVELTPPDHRPYIGGSTTNSALELAVGYNGLGRIFGGQGNFRRGGPRPDGPGQGANRPARDRNAGAPAQQPGPNRDDRGGPPPDGNSPPPGAPPGPAPDANGAPPPFAANGTGGRFSPEGRSRDQAGRAMNAVALVAQAQSSQALAAGPLPYLLRVAELARPSSPRRGGGPGGPGFGFGPGGGPPGGPGFGLPPGRGPDGPRGRGGFGGEPGVLRFAGPSLAGQITWLVPLALVAVVAAVRFRWPASASPAGIAVFLWAGWLVTHWVVFSWASGIFHEYYTTVMGPALAALVGIGVASLWRQWFHGGSRGFLLPVALILTAAWQVYIILADYGPAAPEPGKELDLAHRAMEEMSQRPWLLPTVLAGALVAVAGMFGLRWFTRYRWLSVCAKVTAAIGVAALLVGPASWSLATLGQPGNAVMPVAPEPRVSSNRPGRGPGMFGPPGMAPGSDSKLIDFLRANRRNERFLVIGPSAMAVAPIIIATGEPAASLGGFMGRDPVVTKDEFVRMVEEGQVRFVFAGGFGGLPGRGPGGGAMRPADGGPPQGPSGPPDGDGMQPPPGPGMQPPAGGPPPGPGGPGDSPNAEIMTWVREHGKEVDAALLRTNTSPEGRGGRPGGRGRGGPGGPGERLYDCRPEMGLIDPSAHSSSSPRD
jgi:4-amino-4-deoxy-L-arabinose transferase-like glycosyltransferase